MNGHIPYPRGMGAVVKGVEVPDRLKDNTLGWFRDQVEKLLALPGQIQSWRERLLAARARGVTAAQVNPALEAVSNYSTRVTDLLSKLVFQNSLGAVPLLLGVVAGVTLLAVAVTAFQILQERSTIEQLIQAVENGTLDPEDIPPILNELPPPGSGPVGEALDLVKLAMIAGLGFVAFKAFKEMR